MFEHITTREAAQYVRRPTASPPPRSPRITCSTTATRSSPAASGRTTTACPCSSARCTALALVEAATSGSPKFFLGTDSAPHAAHLKEHASGCAGCYTAHAAMELYAEAFDDAGALDQLEGFASFHGADFYGLPRNDGTITLRREAWTVPESYRLRRGAAQAAARRRNRWPGRWIHERQARVALLIDADNVARRPRSTRCSTHFRPAGETSQSAAPTATGTKRAEGHGRSCCTSTPSGPCCSSINQGKNTHRHGAGDRRAWTCCTTRPCPDGSAIVSPRRRFRAAGDAAAREGQPRVWLRRATRRTASPRRCVYDELLFLDELRAR